MNIKKIFSFFSISVLIIIIIVAYFNHKNKINKLVSLNNDFKENFSNTNIIENIKHISKDNKGNEYMIIAANGEIDLNQADIIFLKDVYATIKLANSEKIEIKSKFGKYNIKNYDTIFSKKVLIKYLDNKITSDYLDFSLKNNLMIISRDVTYETKENTLKSDVIEMNIKTKDTKIFMYEKYKKVKIINKK